MPQLPLRYYGDPVLEMPCSPVEEITPVITTLIDNMVETMYEKDGIGLAAPQVGITKRITVIDITHGQMKKELLVLVNPEFLHKSSDSIIMKEGCLSFPDIEANIERPKSIKIRAQDRSGNEFTLEATDVLARVIQHEVDHLDGILFTQHMPRLEKELLLKKLRTLRKQSKDKLAKV